LNGDGSDEEDKISFELCKVDKKSPSFGRWVVKRLETQKPEKGHNDAEPRIGTIGKGFESCHSN